MPNKKTVQRAQHDLEEGKSPSTAAGEFVREEMEHIREGQHGARSTKQAIAIGLSKARRAGVPLSPPRAGATSPRTRKAARRDVAIGERKPRISENAPDVSTNRSRSAVKALRREGRGAASHQALAKQAKRAAERRGPQARTRAAKKAAATKARARMNSGGRAHRRRSRG